MSSTDVIVCKEEGEEESPYEIMRDAPIVSCPRCKEKMRGDSRAVLTVCGIEHEFCTMVCASKWWSMHATRAHPSLLSMKKKGNDGCVRRV